VSEGTKTRIVAVIETVTKAETDAGGTIGIGAIVIVRTPGGAYGSMHLCVEEGVIRLGKLCPPRGQLRAKTTNTVSDSVRTILAMELITTLRESQSVNGFIAIHHTAGTSVNTDDTGWCGRMKGLSDRLRPQSTLATMPAPIRKEPLFSWLLGKNSWSSRGRRRPLQNLCTCRLMVGDAEN